MRIFYFRLLSFYFGDYLAGVLYFVHSVVMHTNLVKVQYLMVGSNETFILQFNLDLQLLLL